MPKNMKLDLNGLKVKSFVTSLDEDEKNKINGGWRPTHPVICETASWCDCPASKYTVSCATCELTCIDC